MKTKKNKLFLSLFCILSLFFFMRPVFAETIPDRPPLNGIYDPHHYLSKEVSDKLSSMNWGYSRTEAKPQIAIAIVDNLDGDLETVANNVARNWQVGFSDTNYGMLVLISVKERKIRTEVSNNMGAIIPDSIAQELNDSIKDDFRNEDYSSGILKYLSKVEGIITPYLSKNKEKIEEEQREAKKAEEEKEKEYVKKFGPIGAVLFGFCMSLLFFVMIKHAEYSKKEEEYYKKHGYRHSFGGGIYSSSHTSSGSYDSFSGSSSSGSSDSSSSWSGGGFDGGGSSGGW